MIREDETILEIITKGHIRCMKYPEQNCLTEISSDAYAGRGARLHSIYIDNICRAVAETQGEEGWVAAP